MSLYNLIIKVICRFCALLWNSTNNDDEESSDEDKEVEDLNSNKSRENHGDSEDAKVLWNVFEYILLYKVLTRIMVTFCFSLKTYWEVRRISINSWPDARILWEDETRRR